MSMGIYLHNMEMPKEVNWRSIRIYPDGTIGRPIGFGDYALVEGAKAVPVPPHGRLIDADALAAEMKERQTAAIKWMLERVQDYDASVRAEATVAFLNEVKLTLDKMPTIIPAEEG